MKNFSKFDLEEVLAGFLGKQKQIPPKYSAIKINGKKLYELARKGVEIKDIPEREVEIYYLELLDFNLPYAKIKVGCSSGTYIRSLVSDIGQKLETGAYMSGLIRTKSNDFSIENSTHHHCSMCGPKFCSMRVSKEIREMFNK